MLLTRIYVRLEEIDLNELALRFGIRVEISAATINMLLKSNPFIRSFSVLAALRNIVFQLRFATLVDAAEKMTSKSIQGKLKLKKDDLARKVQSTLKNFTEDYKLPIKEISKVRQIHIQKMNLTAFLIRSIFKSRTMDLPCNSPV